MKSSIQWKKCLSAYTSVRFDDSFDKEDFESQAEGIISYNNIEESSFSS